MISELLPPGVDKPKINTAEVPVTLQIHGGVLEAMLAEARAEGDHGAAFTEQIPMADARPRRQAGQSRRQQVRLARLGAFAMNPVRLELTAVRAAQGHFVGGIADLEHGDGRLLAR